MKFFNVFGTTRWKRAAQLREILEEEGFETHEIEYDSYNSRFIRVIFRHRELFKGIIFNLDVAEQSIRISIAQRHFEDLDDKNLEFLSSQIVYHSPTSRFYLILSPDTVGYFSAKDYGTLGRDDEGGIAMLHVKDPNTILNFRLFFAGERQNLDDKHRSRVLTNSNGLWEMDQYFNSEIAFFPAGDIKTGNSLLGRILYQVRHGEDFNTIPYVYIGNMSHEFDCGIYGESVLLCHSYFGFADRSSLNSSSTTVSRVLISDKIQGGDIVVDKI